MIGLHNEGIINHGVTFPLTLPEGDGIITAAFI